MRPVIVSDAHPRDGKLEENLAAFLVDDMAGFEMLIGMERHADKGALSLGLSAHSVAADLPAGARGHGVGEFRNYWAKFDSH